MSPYIKKEEKEYFKEGIAEITRTGIQTCGELNYLLTKICQIYINQRGMQKYQFYNDVVGALECCKIELYRRQIADYEEQKIVENGDVY